MRNNKLFRSVAAVSMATMMLFAVGCSSDSGEEATDKTTSNVENTTEETTTAEATTEAPTEEPSSEEPSTEEPSSEDGNTAGGDYTASKVLGLSFEGNLDDNSGKGNNGTANKDASYVEGVNGQAFYFDGSTYIDLGTSGTLQPAQLTFSAWIKADGTIAGENIITWFKPSGNYQGEGWYLSCLDDATPLKLSVGKSTGQPYELYVSGNRAEFFPDGEWVHIAVTYDSTSHTACIYRNGVAQEVQILNDQLEINADETSNKFIGFNSPGYNGGFAKMTMDEVEVYSTVLTATDVEALYNANK